MDGIGQLCKQMILCFANMGTEGFQFGSIAIWAKVGKFVADDAAFKANFDVKGAGGSMPCLKCRMHTPDGMVSIAETDTSKFRRHTDSSIIANANLLDANKTSQDFSKLQMSLGLGRCGWPLSRG